MGMNQILGSVMIKLEAAIKEEVFGLNPFWVAVVHVWSPVAIFSTEVIGFNILGDGVIWIRG